MEEPRKKIVAYYRNGYGAQWYMEFECAEDYLEWKRKNPEEWNNRNETYVELIKVTTRFLPLDWRGIF